jgi:hypothetical protein
VYYVIGPGKQQRHKSRHGPFKRENTLKAQIQIQSGPSFKTPSITLTRGGDTVLIPLTKKKADEIKELWKKIPVEG